MNGRRKKKRATEWIYVRIETNENNCLMMEERCKTGEESVFDLINRQQTGIQIQQVKCVSLVS